MIVPLVLRVVGEPAPKGSGRAMTTPSGQAVHVPSGSSTNARKLKGWASSVSDAFDAVRPSPIEGPVAIAMVFRARLRRSDVPAGRLRTTAPFAVIVKPDADKLVRTTLDALTAAGAWGDDSQVAIMLAAKIYVPDGEPTGAMIALCAADPDRQIEGVIDAADQICASYLAELRTVGGALARVKLQAAHDAPKARKARRDEIARAQQAALDLKTREIEATAHQPLAPGDIVEIREAAEASLTADDFGGG